MFSGYNPFGYSGYNLVDPDYYRALAEERAAHNQYLAARHAQEQARQRAARARAAWNGYNSPYNSYLTDDIDDDLGDSWDGGYTYALPRDYGSGLIPHQRRALLEEQRRRELLQLEREREMERLRLEEERRKLEEEKRRHALLEEERRRREQFDPFARAFGWRPLREEVEQMVSFSSCFLRSANFIDTLYFRKRMRLKLVRHREHGRCLQASVIRSLLSHLNLLPRPPQNPNHHHLYHPHLRLTLHVHHPFLPKRPLPHSHRRRSQRRRRFRRFTANISPASMRCAPLTTSVPSTTSSAQTSTSHLASTSSSQARPST